VTAPKKPTASYPCTTNSPVGRNVLTKRERQVLAAAAAGATNAEIAAKLVIAPGTVKKHLDNIYNKLGAANRTDAVIRMRDIAPSHPLERPREGSPDRAERAG